MRTVGEKSIIKKYYFSLILFMAAVYAVTIPLFIFSEPIWLKALVLILALLILKFGDRYLGVKHFISILIIEKDGKKFASVMKPSKYFSPSAQYRALGAYYAGDHRETVNICTKAMKSEAGKNRECFYAEKLARTYFELGDDDKLRSVLNYFNKYTAASTKGEAIRKNFPVMDFFAAYLGGDISECERALEAGAEIEKRQYANLYNSQRNFLFAAACFRLGEKERARNIFEEVICDAPKTHFSRLAHKYLDAIAMEASEMPESAEVLPDEDFEIYGKRMRTYMKIRKPLFITLIVILAICLGILFVLRRIYL
jgi:tetratricopeptide (TPR) repeat protein